MKTPYPGVSSAPGLGLGLKTPHVQQSPPYQAMVYTAGSWASSPSPKPQWMRLQESWDGAGGLHMWEGCELWPEDGPWQCRFFRTATARSRIPPASPPCDLETPPRGRNCPTVTDRRGRSACQGWRVWSGDQLKSHQAHTAGTRAGKTQRSGLLTRVPT